MGLKKSDLYRSLWKSCDELRGGMDASQYKDYVLTLLFVKYVTDKQKADPDSLIVVPSGGSFDDIVALRGDKEIGDKINKIIAKLVEANGLQREADFNDDEKLGKGKEMQDRLSKLVAIFADLDFGGIRAEGDDLLGDAYEYLMRHFATESGKSKGQFYTPAEVSRVLAKVVGINSKTRQDRTVYDPACGSGSLLLKAAAEAPRGMTIYGQEKDNATWALSKMNMILHGNEIADIRKGDTITNPQFTKGTQLRTFDFIVMNPPFSLKSWSNGLENEYGRFEFGKPPAKNGDYAFLLHALKSLKSTGKAAVIMPHGVLFRGNSEATIRKALLQRGYIRGIIGLPPNLFYGTGIPACIVVLDKENAQARTSVFMMDASKGFIKDGAKNRLRSRDIHKIVDVFIKQMEIDGYSRLVPIAEIGSEDNACNLNLPRYIDPGEPDNLQDLDGHLNGGIPDRELDLMTDFWATFPGLREELFEPEREGYERLRVEPDEVRPVIEANPEHERLERRLEAGLEEWWAANPALEVIDVGTEPKPLIAVLSEDLFQRFEGVTPLLTNYDVYEQLMVYWTETMQDDVHLVSVEGWLEAARPRSLRQVGVTTSGKPKLEEPDLTIGKGRSRKQYKMDLLPPAIIIRRFFLTEERELGQLSREADLAERAVEAFVEEHTGEGDSLEEILNDKGKITKAALSKQIKSLREDPGRRDDLGIAERCQRLRAAAAAARMAADAAEAELLTQARDKYAELDVAEVKNCVMREKWLETLRRSVRDVLRERVAELTTRVRDLDRRYARTLDDLHREEEALRERVASHLAALGPELERV